MPHFRLFSYRRGNRRSTVTSPSRLRQNQPGNTSRTSSPRHGLTGLKLRGSLVLFLLVTIWVSLWLRAAWIQLVKGPDYAESARRQHIASETVDMPRGMITDRNGLSLARSIECSSIYANPGLIDDPAKAAEVLAPLVHQPKEKIEKTLRRQRSFAWIARRVDDATAEAVRRAKIPGIMLTRDYERVYPYRQVAGQLLGFVGSDGKGLEGIERAYDAKLAGSRTRNLIQRDALGRRFQVDSIQLADNPEDLILTLDLHVQFIAEDILASTVNAQQAKWGGMLVVDVPTGDILAWAQYPSFNPNRFRDTHAGIYRNRLALDALEPGSTIKPLLVAAAMKEKLINRNSKFDCEQGRWRTRSITIRDDGRSYGILPVHRIVALSSNIGSAKLGLLLGAPRYHKFLVDMGFGQRTSLPLAQSKGILRSAREWRESDLMSSAFGQSLSVTAVQLAQAYLTLANRGVYRPLNIVMNEGERVQSPTPARRVIPDKVCREVLSIMREVVEDGTARRAAVAGLSIAGKTGTAQKADNHGKYGAERMASFVGMLPAERPRYLIIVMLDEPEVNKYGGAIAAPAFREMLIRMLSYYGELPAEPQENNSKPIQKLSKAINGQIRNTLNAGVSTEIPEGSLDEIPDVIGMPVRFAVEKFARIGIVPRIQGSGDAVVRQEPAPGTKLEPQSENGSELSCTLWLSEEKN